MWSRAKYLTLTGLVCFLGACSSTFSSYDSSFSCKNSDHGGCEHPGTAYQNALQNMEDTAAPRESGEKAGDISGQGGSYEGYKGAVYKELQALIESPVTPMVAPAKTVRTLILPHTDRRDGDQRLYMPRYIFSVVEEARFVLEGTVHPYRSSPMMEDLVRLPSEGDPSSASSNKKKRE
ncbi:TraV family lipoprotein [Kordiimonas pumila]|uniref:TraV family lipoprotein n=1 Tax=Kordiimonas pumila TaxID=2161677 RepID=A0ABV7D5P4_9PROT|nr:TraV family lipoprotein [Kordiimonas pumila]